MKPFKSRKPVFQWNQLKKRGFHIDEFLFIHMLLHGFTRHEATVQGVTLHWVQKASKDPQKKWVILVHGIASTSSHWGRTAIDLVNRGYSVIALDSPFHGRSDDPFDLEMEERPTCTPEYFFSLFSEWMTKVAPTITQGSYSLVGNSLGGGMCLRFAHEHPEWVNSLMLISPAGGFESKHQWEEFRKELQFVERSAQAPDASEDQRRAKNYIERIYHKPPVYTFALARPFMKAMSEGGLREMVALSNFETAALFPKKERLTLEMPTLMIWGKSEKLFPRTHLENFKKCLHAKAPATVVFDEPEGVGHVPLIEQPLWLSERLAQFMAHEK